MPLSRARFDPAPLRPLQQALEEHPVYESIRDMADLRCFMEHHVYPVWDFMSLLKALQQTLAPVATPWMPVGNPQLRRFVNEIVREEESDEGLPDASGRATYISHFELYLQAMREVGAETGGPLWFLDLVRGGGLEPAFRAGIAPSAAVDFMRVTFGFVGSGKPHCVAAAFALGRENIVPGMFRALLDRMGISQSQAPAFFYYLNRHTHLDEESHGPMAMLMLDELCEGNPGKLAEAQDAAVAALQARIHFWDGVLAAMQK